LFKRQFASPGNTRFPLPQEGTLSLAPKASDGAQSRTTIAETLFSKGKLGTCHDMPPKVESFDASLAANEVLAIEDSIKRCPEAQPRRRMP
jgi:hypothetical protein